MISLIIPIIFMIIILLLFLVFLVISRRQEKTLKTVDKDGKIKGEEKKDKDDKKSINERGEKNTYKKEDVFKFMEFDRILDKMIVQNGGSRFTMAIQCKGINYDLMSEVEQLSVEEGFIDFLNTLKYPIQFYVQAQNVDLKGVVSKYRSNIEELTTEYNDINAKYNKIVSSFDADERELENITKERDRISNVYEYANDIIRYVDKMSTSKSLLQRKFYILISYNTSEINAVDKFSKEEIVEMCSTELLTRCTGIISALSSCSVSGRVLDSNELADLLYSAYNRDDKSIMSVKEALESGLFRLYSTSEDAFEKEQEALEKYLQDQSKLKAYKAIKYVIENNEIRTSATDAIEEEEETSRRATNYIKNSDLDPDIQKKANKKILDDYRERKKELLDINEHETEEIKKRAKEEIKEIDRIENEEKPKGIQLLEKSKLEKNSNIDNNNYENSDDKNQLNSNNEVDKKVENDNNEDLYGENDIIV